MNNFKAIVIDLDGTLLNEAGVISKRTKEFLLDQKERGTKIILATGRPMNMTIQIHQELELDTPFICLNGALVYGRHQDQVIYDVPIQQYDVEYVNKLVLDKANMLLCHTSHANYQLKNESGIKVEDYFPVEKLGRVPNPSDPILKLSVYMKERKLLEQAMEQLSSDFEIADWEHNFEVTRKSVTKWHSLEVVLQQLNINSKEVVAFGDGANDLEMIMKVGVGVAMGNAIPSLKAVSKFVTLTNDEDGIIKFIEKYQLDNRLAINKIYL